MNSRKSCLEELFQIQKKKVALFNQYLVHLHGDFHKNKESTKNLANSTMKKKKKKKRKKKNSVPIFGFVELLLLLLSIAAR